MVLIRTKQRIKTWALLLVITAMVAGGLAWKHHIAAGLEEQIERERELQAARERSDAERRLAANAAVTPQAVEIDAEDEAVIARLRKEISELKARAAARSKKPVAMAPSTVAGEPSIMNGMLPFDQWKNAGHATPAAALETALWAASVGEVNVLAELLSIDPVVRSKVNVMMVRLPETLRREYDTPERFVALLTARAVPLGAAQIQNVNTNGSTDTRLTAVLRDTDQRQRTASVMLRQEGQAWKLLVPGEAIERYAAMLRGTGTSSAAR